MLVSATWWSIILFVIFLPSNFFEHKQQGRLSRKGRGERGEEPVLQYGVGFYPGIPPTLIKPPCGVVLCSLGCAKESIISLSCFPARNLDFFVHNLAGIYVFGLGGQRLCSVSTPVAVNARMSIYPDTFTFPGSREVCVCVCAFEEALSHFSLVTSLCSVWDQTRSQHTVKSPEATETTTIP